MGKLSKETESHLDELILSRLHTADVEGKVQESFDKIATTGNDQENDIWYFASEIQKHSYIAGLKDGARLMMNLGVAVNE